MKLTVVVPTLGRTTLARCLAALRAQTEPALEIIVAADARAPALAEETVRASRPGASAARNAGWRAARAPLVLFLDDDILAGPELAAKHLGAHAREPAESVAVLGHVRWADELRATGFMRWLERGFQFEYAHLTDGEDVGWGRFYTANVSVKRTLLARAGGFDEEGFPFHYEDLELARRLAALELVVRYVGAARAEHLSAPTLAAYTTRMAEIAPVERRWVARHPSERPHFHDLLAPTLACPAARGRLGPRLAGHLPGRLDDWAWRRADFFYRRSLAPAFMAAWERAGPPT